MVRYSLILLLFNSACIFGQSLSWERKSSLGCEGVSSFEGIFVNDSIYSVLHVNLGRSDSSAYFLENFNITSGDSLGNRRLFLENADRRTLQIFHQDSTHIITANNAYGIYYLWQLDKNLDTILSYELPVAPFNAQGLAAYNNGVLALYAGHTEKDSVHFFDKNLKKYKSIPVDQKLINRPYGAGLKKDTSFIQFSRFNPDNDLFKSPKVGHLYVKNEGNKNFNFIPENDNKFGEKEYVNIIECDENSHIAAIAYSSPIQFIPTLYKFSNQGEILWELDLTVGFESRNISYIKKITSSSFIVALTRVDVNNETEFVLCDFNGFIIKRFTINTSFTLPWIRDILSLSNGDILVSGFCISDEDCEPTAGYLARINSVFDPDPVTDMKTNSFSGLTFYPNPARNVLNIVLDNLPNREGNLEIQDLNGRTIKQFLLDGKPTQSIDISGIDAGMYVVSVSNEAGEKGINKLINILVE